MQTFSDTSPINFARLIDGSSAWPTPAVRAQSADVLSFHVEGTSSSSFSGKKRARPSSADFVSPHGGCIQSQLVRTSTWPEDSNLPLILDNVKQGLQSSHSSQKLTAQQRRQKVCFDAIQRFENDYYSDIECLKAYEAEQTQKLKKHCGDDLESLSHATRNLSLQLTRLISHLKMGHAATVDQLLSELQPAKPKARRQRSPKTKQPSAASDEHKPDEKVATDTAIPARLDLNPAQSPQARIPAGQHGAQQTPLVSGHPAAQRQQSMDAFIPAPLHFDRQTRAGSAPVFGHFSHQMPATRHCSETMPSGYHTPQPCNAEIPWEAYSRESSCTAYNQPMPSNTYIDLPSPRQQICGQAVASPITKDSRDGIEMEDSGLDCEMLNFDLSEPEFTDEEWMSFLKRIPSNC